jgi:hypothetical protein
MIDERSPKWRVHTGRLLAEVMSNPTTWPLKIPMLTLDNILRQVASRAIQLDDPKLNQLMMRLALYSISDPYSEDYDEKFVSDAIAENILEEAA